MSGTDPTQSGFSVGDPFSMAAASGQPDAPGTGWQHLAMFGGNMLAAANARTPSGHLMYGTGFGGPLGVATINTMQQAGQQAQQRQELQSGYLRNQLAQATVPLQIQQAQFSSMMRQHPEMLNDFMGRLGFGGQSQQQSAQPASAGGYAGAVDGLEGNGQNPRSSASGVGGFIDGTKAAFVSANPQYFTGMSPVQVNAAFSDPKTGIGERATNWYAQQNTPVLSSNGVQPSGPNLAMAHRLGPLGAVAVAKSPDNIPLPVALQQTLSPQTVQQYVQANPQFAQQTVGQFRSQFANVPDYGPPADHSQSNALYGQANRAEIASGILGFKVGDPATMRDQAKGYFTNESAGPNATAEARGRAAVEQQTAGPIETAKSNARNASDLNYAGPIGAAKSAVANLDVRPGGMVRTVDANGTVTWVKNPQLEEVTDPATGEQTYSHISPAMPNAPPGTPGTSEPVLDSDGKPVTKRLPPNVQDARTKAYTDFAGKDADSFVAAGNTQGLLTQMNQAAAELNQNQGFMNTGPLAPARMAFASKVNDIFNTAGLGRPFNPNAVGAWEELVKATKTAGFELASHYEGHARQAAQTIENATSAVPSEVNSPIGFKKVSAGVNEIAQMTKDAHAFAKQPVYDKNGDLVKAETSFYTNFPAQMYARRAISTVQPYPVQSDADLNRYLPGTVVLYKGNKVQVPARPDAPPIPDYLTQHATPAQ